ncbi:MAG: hypothetical protein PHC34_07785 [Candidatus Gastranaerophilales bacterium]|nr:hypothetical protein [Candidatus Gastranaerophilales bacterium]
MERYDRKTRQILKPDFIDSHHSDSEKQKSRQNNIHNYHDRTVESVQNSADLLANLVQPMEIKRQKQGELIKNNEFPDHIPATSTNILEFASTIKYNETALGLMRIGNHFRMNLSGELDELMGESVASVSFNYEQKLIEWLMDNRRPDKILVSEVEKIINSSSYNEMVIKSRSIDRTVFPSEIPNLPVIKSSHIDVEKIKRNINFMKKLNLRRKAWDEKLLSFDDRIREIGQAELVISRLESAMSKIRSEQNFNIASGKKNNPLERNKRNILQLISTIEYNDAVWTIQTLGVDSGMRFANGISRTDAEKVILNNDYISDSTLFWLVNHCEDKRFINEAGRLLSLVENSVIIRSIEEDWPAIDSEFKINVSAFPVTLPNILVMNPVRFSIRK